MNLSKKDIVTLGKQVAKFDRKAPGVFKFQDKEFTKEAMNEALRDEFNALGGDYNSYRRNKVDVFEMMQEIVDDVLPNKVISLYGEWANTKQFAQGTKPYFVMKAGAQRAKRFITKVGLAGVYEVFKLDKKTVDIETTAYGGAAQVGLEEFLDGAVDFTELIDIIVEGMADAIYVEIAKALEAIDDSLPSANVASGTGFDADEFDELLIIARAYGGAPLIMTSLEFAQQIIPAEGWVSDDIRNEMNSQGYVGNYKGARVIVMPQSFTDETNATKIFPTDRAWIVPTGGNTKPVYIAMEGDTIIDEYENRDRSREIQAYKKFGVAMIATNDICLYTDVS